MTQNQTTNVIYMFDKSSPEAPDHQVPSVVLQAALEMVANAHDSGLVMVPNVASPDMVAAAQTISCLSETEIQKIWQAMLQAW